VEITDKWLKGGWPWELPQPDEACFVGFGGRTESYIDDKGSYRSRWIPAEHAIGIPHDVPVLGYRVNICDRLRLWRADATESFDFARAYKKKKLQIKERKQAKNANLNKRITKTKKTQ